MGVERVLCCLLIDYEGELYSFNSLLIMTWNSYLHILYWRDCKCTITALISNLGAFRLLKAGRVESICLFRFFCNTKISRMGR